MTIHGYNGRGEKLKPDEVMSVMKTNQKACDNSDEIFDLAKELNLPIDKFAEFVVDMPSPKNTRSVIYKVEMPKEVQTPEQVDVYDDECSQESSGSSQKETTFQNFAAPMTPLRQNESIGEESEDYTPIFFGNEQLRLHNNQILTPNSLQTNSNND